jgi:RHS repeat-associated protein
MFTIRNEQFALLRKQTVGDGLAKTFRQAGQQTERDAASGDVLVSDARGHRTRFAFDKYGFIGSVTSPLGRIWRLENDEQGRLHSLTNPAGLRLGYAYNSRGEVSSVSHDASQLLTLEYDELSRPVKLTYADQTSTRIKYSPFNHPSSVTNRLGATESYEYDSSGNLISLADGNGNQSAFDYSNRDRPDRVRYADGSTESYAYDPNGLVQKILAGSATIAVLEHDAQGHPTKISYEDGEVLSFRYNEQGKVVEAQTAELTTLYEYDGAGRVIREEQGQQVIKYEYDESGTLVALVYPSGEKVEFGHDEDLRLSSIRDWSGGLHGFSYDLNDRETTLRSPNYLVTTIRHTPQGLPASHAVSRGSADLRHLFALNYQYDAEDRVVSFRDSDFGSRRYAYDAEGRLLTAGNDKTGGGEVFAYDRAGNRTYSNGETAAFNALNQLQAQGSTRCSYDGRGNLVSLSSPEGEWRFVYNSRNLMVRADGWRGQSLTFGYDAFGRRSWKRSGERETRYVWAGEQLVREITIKEARTTRTQDYLYLPGTYTPVATRVDDQIYYYHTDHLGTPRRMTDSKGNVVWAADYSAFGLARPTVKTVENRLRFPGQYEDEETGLHYNRFRYYAPALGRYLSRDPVTYLSGQNFYVYAGNNPINSADPLGLWSWKTVVSVVAAVAVGIAVVALAPIALPLAIVAAGAAAGAVGAGLNEALNQEEFCLSCIAKAALKGAFVGTIAALPFAFLPVTAGVAAYMGVGAISGALSYAAEQFANYPDSKWSWKDFAISVGIGAATAGLGRYLGGKYSQWKQNNSISASQSAEARATAEAANHPANKTVSADGGQTLSGWKNPPEGYTQATPEQVAEYSDEIGHELRPSGGPDQVNRGGFPGKFNASHAEKQMALQHPNEPLGVSKPMCPDCQNFFKLHAEYTGKPQYVTDPQMTRIFHPDGTVTEIPRP